MMKDLDITPITQFDLIPILNPYLNYNQDIIQIVFKFSDHSIAGSLIDFSYDIIKSSFAGKDNKVYSHSFWLALLTAILVLPAYFPVFYIVEHMKDSYKSYVEIDCQYYVFKKCDDWDYYYGPGENGPKTRKKRNHREVNCQWEWTFDFNDHDVISCSDYGTEIGFDEYMTLIHNISNYTVKARTEEIEVDSPLYSGDTCYVNTDDFKFRTGNGDNCGCCIRFGKISCESWSSEGCSNCCGYWFLSIFVLVYVTLIGFLIVMPVIYRLDKYDIHVKASYHSGDIAV